MLWEPEEESADGEEGNDNSLIENRWQMKGVPNPEKCSEVPPAGLLTREAMLCLCASVPARASCCRSEAFEEGGVQPGNQRGVAGGEECRLGRELRKHVREERKMVLQGDPWPL